MQLSSSKEINKKNPSTGLDQLRKGANQVPKLDQNIKYTKELVKLQSNIDPMRQIEGITFLQHQLMHVLAKMKKAHPKLNLKKITPQSLSRALSVYKVPLSISERNAVIHLNRLNLESGLTTNYILKSWPKVIQNADEASKGWTDKLKTMWKKDPIRTSAYLVAGATGVYLGYKAISGIWNWLTGNKTASSKPSILKRAMGSKVGKALLLLTAGAVIGKAAVGKILSTLGYKDLSALWARMSKMKSVSAATKKEVKTALAKAKNSTAVVSQKTKVNLSKAKEGIKKSVESKSNRFKLTREIFLNINFYDRREFPPTYRNKIDSLILSLKDKKISEIKSLYESNRVNKKISVASFPVEASFIKRPEHLFILSKGIVQLSQLSKNKSENLTVKELFSNAAKNPILRSSMAFHKSILGQVQKGSLSNFSTLDYKSINSSMDKNKKDFFDSLNQKFPLPSDFTKDDINQFRVLQLKMFGSRLNLKMGPDQILKKVVNENSEVSEKIRIQVKNFFNYIKSETHSLLPKIYDRFGINIIQGQKQEDILGNHLKMENLTLNNAIKMVSVAQLANFEKKSNSMDWMKDLALLNVVISSLDPTPRDLYIGQLARVFAGAESNINVSTKNLRPYMNKVFQFGVNWLVEKGYATLLKASALRGAKANAEMIKKQPFVAFQNEAGSAAFEVSTKALALIITVFGIKPERLSHSQTAEDLFKLILSKGGNVVYPQTVTGGIVKGGGMALEFGGKFFFLKPLEGLSQVWSSFRKDGLLDAGKTYVVKGAPYMILGAGATLLGKSKDSLPVRLLKTPLAALKSPVTIPFKAGRYAIGFGKNAALMPMKAVFTGKEMLQQGVKAPVRVVAQAGRQISSSARSVWGFKTPAQNLTNILKDVKDLEYFQKRSASLRNLTFQQKVAGVFNGELSQVFADSFNKSMATKAARRLANYYNNFFHFQGIGSLENSLDQLKNEKNVNEILERVSSFVKSLNKLNGDSKAISNLKNLINSGGDVSEFLQNTYGFKEFEANSLMKNLKTSKQIDDFFKKLTREIGAFQKASDTVKNTAKSTAKAVDTVSDATQNAPKAKPGMSQFEYGVKRGQVHLDDMNKALKNAQNKLNQAKRMGVGVDKAQQAVNQASKAVQAAEDYLVQAKKLLQYQKELSNAAPGSAQAKNLAKLIETTKGFADSRLNDAMKLADDMAKTSVWAKALKGLGIGGSGLGAIYSSVMSGARFYETATTKVAGRRALTFSSGSLYGLNAAADAGALAVILGKAGGVSLGSKLAAGASRLALPLIPITYAAENAYSALYERTLRSSDWSQKYSPHQLYHEFFTSKGSVSVGDAFAANIIVDYFKDSINTAMSEKEKTMFKIYSTLITSQTRANDLMKIRASNLSNEEKAKQLGKIIKASVTKNHIFFFKQNSKQIESFSDARRFVADADIFNNLMVKRDQLKKKGVKSFKVGGLNLMNEKYTINEKGEAKFTYAQNLVDQYKQGQMDIILKKASPVFKENLEKIDPSYLSYLYIQCQLTLRGESANLPLHAKLSLARMSQTIGTYLSYKKGINLVEIIQNPVFRKPKLNADLLSQRLSEFGSKEMVFAKSFETMHHQDKPGILALHKLAQYFGYTGYPRVDILKKFFNKDRAKYQGVYFDGGQWKVNDTASKWNDPFALDDAVGSELNYETVQKIVQKLYNNHNAVLEHRSDSVLKGAYDFTNQSKKMAEILQNSYNSSADRFNDTGKRISFIASGKIERKKIKATKENFARKYEDEIKRIRRITKFSRIESKIEDENTIILKRKGAEGFKTIMKKQGDTWNLEGYARGLDFDQAILLGNILNYAKKKAVNLSGGSDRPFMLDGKDIEFDNAWSPVDTTFISGTRAGNALDVYRSLGVKPSLIVDTLNNWYYQNHSPNAKKQKSVPTSKKDNVA